MNTAAAIKAYTNVGIDSMVMSADPHKLISMLYDGALLAIAKARKGMIDKDIRAKGAAISHAIAIIGEGLHASLDIKVGGELAENLASLYDYMVKRLVAANANNDEAALDEVRNLLVGLQDAWNRIRPT
jgi:flagellar protein FliS